MVGLLGNIIEGAIKVNGDELGIRVSLRSLSCSQVQGIHGIKHVSHEVASTFSQLYVEIINILLNSGIDLKKLTSHHRNNDSMEGRDHSVPNRAGCFDCDILEINKS